MKVFLLFHFTLVAVMFSACGDVNNQAQIEEFLTNSVENNSTKNEENSTQKENNDNVSSSNIVITTTTKTDENSNETNSSSNEQNSTEGNLTDFSKSPIINDLNNTGSPDDNGSNVPPVDDINASTDVNTTSVDDTNTSSDMNSTGTVIIRNPVLDSVDAVVDVNACQVGESFASSIRDFSDNNDAQVSDTMNGVAIQSLYTETGNIDNSTVIALYPKLSETSKLNMSLDYVNIYGDNAQFVLSFNEVWFEEAEPTFYVITPKKNSGLFACFRLIVKKDENSTLSFQKVYR